MNTATHLSHNPLWAKLRFVLYTKMLIETMNPCILITRNTPTFSVLMIADVKILH